ncbi:alanine/glycine:cation symporter family protein [Tindallia californiensis]|uniref:Alanine or glycine:cation symporter, AGCS family n=1 Tax=Tindallia californiensis TaxID=159292 RepID=A0A1H3PAK0_9FIRM|nr:sodium:alanine symporter family protein [Tindallia californiensis]SDY98164.1 alanine or glycine:cation symporter, AGCS family [Tindallia californiensis]
MLLFENFVAKGAELAWGSFTILLLVGTGLYLSIGTRFVQFRKIGTAIKSLFDKNDEQEGDISSFQALMTSLAATIGTGNIVGVSSAIVFGGPGAVFWMWVSGAIGGATRFAEALLAVKYRVTNESGEKSGGPMYYIEHGMKEQYGKNMAWLGSTFAFFGFIASFGTGNMAQANSVAQSLQVTFGVNTIVSGLVMVVLVGCVILGGVKSIGKVTEKVVPTMALMYITGSLFAIISNYHLIPYVFNVIFANAFTGAAVGGGVLGTVLRMGIARGVFSNEAGLGSAPIAHAASKNDNPVTEGITASLSTFIATLVVCSMTAFVILISPMVVMTEAGVMEIEESLRGAALTTVAFDSLLPGIGGYIVSLGLVFFAFSTIIGWYYYGVKCAEYIGGLKITKFYTWAWIGLVFIGAVIPLEIVWGLSDMFNGLMALPNLIGLIGLSPVVFAMLKEYDEQEALKAKTPSVKPIPSNVLEGVRRQ